MVQTLQQTTEYPQLLYVSGGRCPCCWSCLSCRLNGTDMYMAGFPGYAAPRAVFLCFRLAHDASHHGRYTPRSGWFYWPRCSSRCAPVLSSGPRSSASWPGPELQKTADSTQLQFFAGHRHFSFRRGSSSWSRLFSRPQRFPSCCSICPRYVGVQILRCCRGEDLVAPTVAARTLSTTSYLAVTCLVFALEYRILDFLGVDL